jgi:hypothetical protein
MRRLTRWLGAPGMAAIFALPLMWTATPPASSHAVKQLPVPHTIAGRWSILFGDFDFVKTSTPGKYTDHVITRRLGVFCSKVNDHSGQIVLHQDKNNWTIYTGTWEWFYPSSCKSAGYGLVTVRLWQAKPYAFFAAYPPKGIKATPDLFRIERIR